jgi:tRNA A37 threonylcarbamoyladenosine synthetase subunit TsaC/SUA5/YrdC
MKKIVITALLVVAAFIVVTSGKSSGGADQAASEDNAEVAATIKSIKEDGPPELRQLPSSVIESTARTFVSGRRAGVISAAQMDRMGGVAGATQSSLLGQLEASGSE